MRSKILLAGFFVISVAVLLQSFSKNKSSATAKPETGSVVKENISLADSNSVQQKVALPESAVATNPTTQTLSVQANSVSERIIELTKLGMKNDAKSFQKIMASLSDADPEIREAAREAVIQFGNRDAIPGLKELAGKTEDPKEKAEILDAAKFLELPSFTEIRAKRRTNLKSNAAIRPQN